MFRKWNRILAFLLSIALVTTTFGSDFASAKVYAEEIEIEENTDENSEEDYEESEEDDEESEEDDEESTNADLPAAEEIPQNASKDGNGEGSGNSGNGEFIPEDGQNGENGAPASENLDDLSKYLLDEEGNVVLDEFGNPVLKEQPVEEETEEEVVEAEEEIDGIKIYYVVSDEDAGSVDNDSDVFAEGKEISGSTAEANEGYKFTYWTDEDGKKVSYKEKFTPSASDLGLSEDSEDEESEDGEEEVTEVTFTANFEVEEATEATFDDEVREQIEIDGVLITFYAKPGVLPDDAKFDVKIVESEAEEEIKEDLQNVLNSETEDEVEVEVKDTVTFDINIYSELSKTADNPEGLVEPKEGDVRVTFEHISEVASTAGDVDTGLAVYHVDGSEVEYQDHAKVSKEDSITFYAEHFSTYTVIIYKNQSSSSKVTFEYEIHEYDEATNTKGGEIETGMTDTQLELTGYGKTTVNAAFAPDLTSKGYIFHHAEYSNRTIKTVERYSDNYVKYTYGDWNSTGYFSSGTTVYFYYTSTAPKYTVKYDLNGGNNGYSYSNNPINDVTNQKEGDTVILASDSSTRFTKAYCTFYGWSTDKNAKWSDEELVKTPGTAYTVSTSDADENNEITFYAVWKGESITVQFDTNGGKGTTPNSITDVEVGSVVTLPSGSGISRDNYTLLGWSTMNTEPGVVYGGSTKGITYNLGSYLELTSDFVSEHATNKVIKMYAVWAPNNLTASLVIAVRFDGTVPAEPSIQDARYYHLNSGDGKSVNLSDYFSPVATVAGDDAVKKVLKQPFYDYVDELVKYGTSPDCRAVRSLLDENHQIRWYVIKHQGKNGWIKDQWHIDGVIEDIQRVRVSYYRNGATSGLEPDSVQVGKGDLVRIEKGTLEKSGFDFVGWNTEADGSGQDYAPGYSFNLNENLVLYAKWQSKAKHSVKYVVNGAPSGTVIPEEAKYFDGETVTVAQPISVEGYDFSGWSTTDVNVQNSQFTMPKKNVTFTGTLTEGEYTITYHLDGGTVNGTNPATYKVTTDTFTLINPTKPGYTFKGWSGTDLDGDANKNVTVAKGSIGDREYTANWSIEKYTISYDLNGGKLKDNEKNPVEYYVTSANITLINPTRTGYTFTGWGGTDLDGNANMTVTIPTGSTGDRNYKAHWSEDVYNIGYDLQGGTDGGANPTTYKVTSDNITLINPTRTGYTFTGWGGTDLDGNANMTVTIPTGSTGDRNYKAHWSEDVYNIGYDLQGGTDGGANPTTYKVTSDNITLINPTRTGYTFTGWGGTDLDGDANMTVTIPTGSTGDRNYKAHWSEDEYTITYHLDGGTVDGTNPATYKVTTDTFTLINPTKPGYTFKGWSGTDLTDDANKNVTVAKGSIGDREYTANWTINKYTISYELNGGKLKDNEKNPVEYYVTSANITLINPTRPGYTFTGWSGTDLEGSANTTVTIPTGSTGDREYSAHWIIDESKKYTVTYEAQKTSDGKPMGQVTPGSEQAQKLGIVGLEGSEAAANDGYKFNGWAKKNGQNLEPISNTDNSKKLEPAVFQSYLNKDGDGLNADTTFVALFAEDAGQTYTVKYELQMENGAEPKVTPFGELTDTLNQNIQVLKTTGVTGSTASAKNGYSFVGWYKKNANGGLSELTEKVEGAALSNAKAIANLNKKKSGVYDDTTFVAVFKENQNATYKVTYQSADTSKGTVSPSQQFEQVFYARRDKLTGSTVTVIANTGYTFDGWYKINADGTATLVKDATETLTYEKLLPSLNKVGSYYSDTTFEARFKADTNQTYDVLFEAVNGKVDKTGVNGIQVLETTGIADVTASAYEGYTFDSWYVVDSNGNEKKIPNTNAKITASQIIEKLNHKSASVYDNTKFRAKFVIDKNQTYTVSYWAQTTEDGQAMGTVQPESESDQKLSTDKLKGSKAKAGDAYNFIGWYKVNNGKEDTLVSENLTLSNADIVKYLNSHKDQDSGKVVYDDTAFIAKFEIKTFKITYKWMNGAKVDTKTVNYGEFTPIPAELTDSFDKPEAPEGYYFVEWKDKNNKPVDKKTLVAKKVYEAATYEAVYEQKTTLALTFGSDVDSLEKYYDNEPISAKISASNLKERNHKLEVTYDATVEENGNTSDLTNQESISITNVSSATYRIATWKVMDGTKDVSEQYALSDESKETTATLKVNPIPIVIKAGSASKKRFDGNALTNDAYAITLNPEYTVPASSKSIFNEQIKVDPATGIKNVVVEGTITLPGTEPNKVTSYEFGDNALKQNYDVKTVDGELKIGEGDPVEIVIEINANGKENREVVYDGQPHTAYADVDVTANVTTNENPIEKFFTETVIPAAQNMLGIFVIRAAAAEDTDPGKLPEKTFAYGDLTIKVNGLEVVPADGISVDKYPIKLDTSSLSITADIGGEKDVDVKGLFNITIKSPDESSSGNVTTIGYMNITPAPVTVTANSFSRNTAQSDPTLTAAVVPENKNLQADAEEHISYTISRASGNGVGTYAITVTPPADAEKLEDGTYLQGNFKVTYVPGTLTISQAPSGDDDDDDTPSGGDTTIPDAPVALAPSGAVLGAQRVDGDGPAVLGARRAGTDDETNRMARVFAMVAAAAIAVTMMITGKKKDEEEEG